MHTTWRQRAAHIVDKVIRRVGRSDIKMLKRELRKAYPFGERRSYPYKVWLSEVRRQVYGRQRSVPGALCPRQVYGEPARRRGKKSVDPAYHEKQMEIFYDPQTGAVDRQKPK